MNGEATSRRDKALVAGWFSFHHRATAGDVMAAQVACEWLEAVGCNYDVALAAPFVGGVDWETVAPEMYSAVLFVCGPFEPTYLVKRFLDKFLGTILVGLNLSMIEPLDQWQPFDLLWERDSSAASRPDLAFVAKVPKVPVVGVCRVDEGAYHGYRGHVMTSQAHLAIDRLISRRPMAVVTIDTRLEAIPGRRTAAEVDSLVARTDVVLTTRLHGMVLALRNGVPAVVVDPVARGGKIRRQAEAVGWPVVITADSLSDSALTDALDFCLTSEARACATAARDRALAALCSTRDEFLSATRARLPATEAPTITRPSWAAESGESLGNYQKSLDWVLCQARRLPGAKYVGPRARSQLRTVLGLPK